MNPNSHSYLSFNIGYPNAFDRAYGRTGGDIMVHGDCSSRGCYAMTDEQIAEIYALARESFSGDQQWFQVQAYPFRMTPLNLAKHRNNPNVPFWRMLKDGSDHFEVTHLEPKVNVCEYRYVFDAEIGNVLQSSGAEYGADTWRRTDATAITRATPFNPTGWCPAYQTSPDLAAAVAQKGRRDEAEMAEFVERGTSTMAIRTGRDGGTHPMFQQRASNWN
jgi:hypothetical protein